MVDLETIIALYSMTYIVKLDAYELHTRDEKLSTTLLMNVGVFHYVVYMVGFVIIQKHICIHILMILCVLLDFTKIIIYRGF